MFLANIPAAIITTTGAIEENKAFYVAIEHLPKETKDKMIQDRKEENERELKFFEEEKKRSNTTSDISWGLIGFVFGLLIGSD